MNSARTTFLTLLTFHLFTFFAACSDIGEAERLVVVNVLERDTIPTDTVKPDTTDYFAPQGRRVLIEDFTGQDCVNCPNATDLIAQLQDMHGHDRVVAVGIHSGPLGVKPEKNAEGLATELGDIYYKYWQIEMQPYGVIDRSDGPLSTDWWTAKVNWDLAAEQPQPEVNVWVSAATDKERKATIEVTLAAHGHVNGKMQLWIVENGIVAFQKMPDGTTKRDYMHNHVLRDAVNGPWGEDVALEAGEKKSVTHSYAIPQAWNMTNLAIIAFVYNDEKVIQVASAPLSEPSPSQQGI